MKKFVFILACFFTISLVKAQNQIKKDSIETKSNALGRTKEEAKLLAESYRVRVLNGENFSVLATLYSEDPGSAKIGGQLPPFGKGQMVPEFEEVAFKLKSGEISDVFETKYGFHFIQLLAREGEKVVARHILISGR